MNASAANFTTVVTTCTDPMSFTPDRLISAGIQNPTSTGSHVCPSAARSDVSKRGTLGRYRADTSAR